MFLNTFSTILQYKNALVTNDLLLILLCRFNVVDVNLVIFKSFIIIIIILFLKYKNLL